MTSVRHPHSLHLPPHPSRQHTSHPLHHHNRSLPHRHFHLHGVVGDVDEVAVAVAVVEVIVELLVVVDAVAVAVVVAGLLEDEFGVGQYCDIVAPYVPYPGFGIWALRYHWGL